jgi:hypothetical protein
MALESRHSLRLAFHGNATVLAACSLLLERTRIVANSGTRAPYRLFLVVETSANTAFLHLDGSAMSDNGEPALNT